MWTLPGEVAREVGPVGVVRDDCLAGEAPDKRMMGGSRRVERGPPGTLL
jgi:hypothetical protein